MKAVELLEAAQAADSTPFEGTDNRRNAKIIDAVFEDLARRLADADDGRITVAGFGTFVIELGRDGNKKILFRPSSREDTGGTSGAAGADVPAPPRRPKANADKVLVGKSGWLFLRNDINDVIGQHTGIVRHGVSGRARWESLLRRRKDIVDELGIRWVNVIAPDKEAVYAEYLPDDVVPAKRRPVHEVLDAAEAAGVDMVYPLAALDRHKRDQLLYFVTGTHWNFLGAYIAYRVICKRLRAAGVDVDVVARNSIEWHQAPEDDDLGSKIGRSRTAGGIYADMPDESSRVVFNNRIHNHGRVIVFERPDGEGPTGVVIGESFTTWLLRFLKEGFSRLVFMHTAVVSPEILEIERPDALIAVPTERFMIQVPDDDRALMTFLETVDLKRAQDAYRRYPEVRITGALGAEVNQEGELPWDESDLRGRAGRAERVRPLQPSVR